MGCTLYSEWHVSRNQRQRVRFYERIEISLLGCLGYDVSTLPLIQTLHGKQHEVPTLPKKKKESNLGSDSVSN